MKAPFRSTVTLSCLVAALSAAACGRDVTAIVAPSASTTDLLGLYLPDTTVSVIVIDPLTTASYPIAGGHRLWVQKGGVCDLESPYGPALWDELCELATLPIVVIARSWTDAESHPHVQFTPDLRFAPTVDKRASAELYLKDKSAIDDPSTAILYCNEKGCIDEGRVDPTMATMRDRQQGFVYRRIKHFSGYQVSTGRDDEGIPPDSTTYQP